MNKFDLIWPIIKESINDSIIKAGYPQVMGLEFDLFTLTNLLYHNMRKITGKSEPITEDDAIYILQNITDIKEVSVGNRWSASLYHIVTKEDRLSALLK